MPKPEFCAQHQYAAFYDMYKRTQPLDSIEEELNLMRAIVQAKLAEMQEKGDDPNEALDKVAPALQVIARLVKTSQELRERAGEAVRWDVLKQLVEAIVSTVAEEVLPLENGPERMERIAHRIQHYVTTLEG